MRVFDPLLKASLLLTMVACAGSAPIESSEGLRWRESRGVKLKKSAQILFGTAAYCSQPATVDLDAVQGATPEGRKIQSIGISPGSARYRLLRSKMHKRVVTESATIARDAGFDLVVWHGDILDARGLTVGDMTEKLVQTLRNAR
jgi:hypothetical protein